MRKAVLTIIVLLFLFFTITYLTGYSLIIDLSSNKNTQNIQCIDESIIPFEEYDFNSNDDWKMYVIFKGKDVEELPDNVQKVNYLKTTNLDLMKSIKKSWKFKCTEADMATVESKIFLLKNGIKVFESGIVMNDIMQGLQSLNFGWVESQDNAISNDLNKFERTYLPVIFL